MQLSHILLFNSSIVVAGWCKCRRACPCSLLIKMYMNKWMPIMYRNIHSLPKGCCLMRRTAAAADVSKALHHQTSSLDLLLCSVSGMPPFQSRCVQSAAASILCRTVQTVPEYRGSHCDVTLDIWWLHVLCSMLIHACCKAC